MLRVKRKTNVVSRRFFIGLLASTMVTFSCVTLAETSKAPEGAKVYFVTPQNGDTVTSPVKIVFGLSGMGVAPAGVVKHNTGHHHLLIDLKELPDVSQSLPSTDQVKHFGGGQTETMLTLEPGTHTLQLLLGDHIHKPHDKPVLSEKITITVK
ncbi:DUF4399 domain-containing protein [Aurantivibrio plasticivorans]